MNKFPKKKLGCAVKYSTKRVSISELQNSNYVTTDNLLQNKRGVANSVNLPPNTSKVSMFEREHILISNIRPYLKKIWFATKNGGCSADVLNLETIENNDAKFVYYSILSDDFFAHMVKGAKGSKMPRGHKDQILTYLIPDISINDQKYIADIFSNMDSKIEINNKINSELESLAKTIYDYWFVQFDFPDENGKPYKSSGGKMVWNEELKKEIPEGWQVKKISELLPVITGKHDANFATEKGRYNFFTCGEEILRCDSYEFEGKAILVAGNGNFNVKLYEGRFNAYQRTYVLIPNDERLYTLIYMAVKDRITPLRNGSRGSIIKFITKGDLEDILIPLPKDRNFNVFSQINAVTKIIEKNIEENRILTELRDWLLPMLMNGQVKVVN